MWHPLSKVKAVLGRPSVGYAALILMLAAGAFLRLYGIGLPYRGDDALYMYSAREVYLGARPYRDFYMVGPPLNAYLTALVYRLFGVGIAQGHLVTVFFSIASMPLLFHVARRFYGFYPALFSTLVFSLSYGIILLTKYNYACSIPLFFSLLSSYLFLTGLTGESGMRLFLSGLAAGLALLGKLTGVIALASILAYLLVRRYEPRKYAAVLSGFLVVVLPFLIVFLSQDFIEQVFIFHLNKPSYPAFSGVKLGLTSLFNVYPILFIYGLLGSGFVVLSKRRSDADLFYSINAVLAVLLAVNVKTVVPFVSSIYILPSIYSFALLAYKPFKKPILLCLMLFVIVFILFPVLSDIRMLTCAVQDNVALMDDINHAVAHIQGSSSSADYMIASGYYAYYVPFLSERRVVPELVDFNPYRFYSGLDAASLRKLKGRATYIIVSDESSRLGGQRDFLGRLHITPHEDYAKVKDNISIMLVEGAVLAGEYGDISVYKLT
jgi:hypothetical protein